MMLIETALVRPPAGVAPDLRRRAQALGGVLTEQGIAGAGLKTLGWFIAA
ncbi:MAG: hypothetical protein H6518_01955 [Microthrixaceae bacterium]|nr:hypothetical protein [Microthrixaceae bacterium]